MALARFRRWLAVLALATLSAGCASIPADAGSDPRDPWERYNRHVSEFNDRVDRAVFKPLAQGYTKVVPAPARDCVNNFFSNLNDIPNALNNLLQGKPAEAASDLCRVIINSTVGLLGCFDVASSVGLQRHDEDFGQTLARWGVSPGPYFVWPFLGPSTTRDSVGRVVGFYTDPVDYVRDVPTRNTMVGTRVVDFRATLLPAERVLDSSGLDRYRFIRDAYLQRRNSLVHDGNPPRPKDDNGEETAPVYEDPDAPPRKPQEAPADQPAGGGAR